MIRSIRLAFIVLFFAAAPAWAQERPEVRPGLGVAVNAGQPVDPTRNVLDLVAAAIQRQDDLRALIEKMLQTQFIAIEKLFELRNHQSQEMASLLAKKLEDEAKLRAEFSEKLFAAEAKRIDAIRAVDVGAVANASQRTTEQATALAAVVNQSAEVLRNQVSRAAEDTRALVATTAATALQNQQQQFTAITTRIAALEQAGNEQRGKQTVQDPAFVSLLQRVEALSQSRADLAGRSTGQGETIAYVISGVMGLMMLLSLGIAFVSMNRKHTALA